MRTQYTETHYMPLHVFIQTGGQHIPGWMVTAKKIKMICFLVIYSLRNIPKLEASQMPLKLRELNYETKQHRYLPMFYFRLMIIGPMIRRKWSPQDSW